MYAENTDAKDGGDNIAELRNTKFEYMSADNAKYRFATLNDEAKSYLEENGYVVIANVLSSDELKNAIELLWKYLKSIGWRRNDLSTWKDFPGYTSHGVIYKYGIGQSEVQWYTRTCPKVLETFSKLWNVKQTELLTSFDGVGIFRPYDKNPDWKTHGQWFHVDQNPQFKPNLDCYQGAIPLYDQNEYSGGTVVIPKTHTSFQEIFKTIPHRNKNLVSIPAKHWVLNQKKLLVCAKAGDIILWDSRTIHCNTPPLIEVSQQNNLLNYFKKEKEINENENENEVKKDEKVNQNDNNDNEKKKKEFVRLVSYVCMTPKSKANESTIQKRKLAYENLVTSTHIPHEYYVASSPDVSDAQKQKLDKLSDIGKSLIGI